MTTRPLARAVCGLVAAAALGLTTTAHAETLATADPAGDVRHYDLSDDSDTGQSGTELPEREEGDLRRAAVRYGEHRIRMTFRFRELTRRGRVLVVQGRLMFPAGGQLDYTEAMITTTRANRAGRGELSTIGDCDIRHRVSYRHDRAALSFPARCLGTPRWIRFNPGAYRMDRGNEPQNVYVDHLFPVFGDGEGVKQFTPRVRRS